MPTSQSLKRLLIGGSVLSTLVLAGCVSQGEYDKLQTKNTELQQQVAAQSQQVSAQAADIAAKQAEIARRLGISVSAVEKQLTKALAHLALRTSMP